jgi:nitrate reductase NapE component
MTLADWQRRQRRRRIRRAVLAWVCLGVVTVLSLIGAYVLLVWVLVSF